jgi:uncharacterized protein (DUF2237 family)
MRYTNIIILFCIIIVLLGTIAIRRNSRDTFQVQNKNVLGTNLAPCSTGKQKTTGYYRDGYCSTGPTDTGTHVVCARVDNNFLEFTKSKGNDLITPQGSFPGLVAGDNWCLCALRWKEAYKAGKAPKIFPESTNDIVTQYVKKDTILGFAVN